MLVRNPDLQDAGATHGRRGVRRNDPLRARHTEPKADHADAWLKQFEQRMLGMDVREDALDEPFDVVAWYGADDAEKRCDREIAECWYG